MSLGNYVDGYVHELKRSATVVSPGFRTMFIGEATAYLFVFGAMYLGATLWLDGDVEKNMKDYLRDIMAYVLVFVFVSGLIHAVYESVNE